MKLFAGAFALLVTSPLSFLGQASPDVSALLKSDYTVSRIGMRGLQFDYTQVLQPGTVLTVQIQGIYADVANTQQAIVNTVIVNNVAQQQRGVLSALSNTAQGRMLRVGEQVYISRLSAKQDSVNLELLTADLPRYRAEVRVRILGLAAMQAAAVEQVLDAALSRNAASSGSTAQQSSQPARDPGPARGSMSRPGVAPISPEQQQHIQDLLHRIPASVATQVAEAAPTLETYLALYSCINDMRGASQLTTYQGPHTMPNGSLPFFEMRYHDKGSCLNVTRLQGWAPLSLNAFEFQAVYTAADSGESTVRTHTAQKEPDGTWLMNR